MAARNLALIAEYSLGSDATELDAERFANIAGAAGYTLAADGFTFIDADGAEMTENAWQQLLDDLTDPMDDATDDEIDDAARQLINDILDDLGEDADIDAVRAALRDGQALIALGCTSTIVAEAADDEDLIALMIASRQTVYAVYERDLSIVEFNLADALKQFGHEPGDPLLVSDECSDYFFAGSLETCIAWAVEQAVASNPRVIANFGLGERVAAFSTIQAAKSIYRAERQIRGLDPELDDDAPVSIAIAEDEDGDRFYRIGDDGIFTTCIWGNIDDVDDWFDADWIDHE